MHYTDILNALKADNHNPHPILTIEQARELYDKSEFIEDVSCSVRKVVYFTNDHYSFGNHLFKGCSGITHTHLHVTPRPEIEDGIVDSLDKFIKVFYADFVIIQSIEQLAAFIAFKQKEF